MDDHIFNSSQLELPFSTHLFDEFQGHTRLHHGIFQDAISIDLEA
jgi:hypothetical protein